MNAAATDHAVKRFIQRTGRTDFADCYARAVPPTARLARRFLLDIDDHKWPDLLVDPESGAVFVHQVDCGTHVIVTVLTGKWKKRARHNKPARWEARHAQ